MNDKIKMEIYDYIKYAVNVIVLSKIIECFDITKQKEDLIQDLWLAFIEEGNYYKWNQSKGRNLKSFVREFVYNRLKNIFKKLVKTHTQKVELHDIIWDGDNIEELLVDKELKQLLEELNYGGDENRRVMFGEKQVDLAIEAGVTKQAINKKIKKQREKLMVYLKDYYDPRL